MSEYSSVSVEGMDDLVSAMNRAHSTLTSDLDTLRSRMRSADVTTEAFTDLDRIADWVDEQIPGLERRRNLAVAITGDRPETTMVQFEEPLRFDSPEDAEQYGRDLAQQYLEHGTIDAARFDELFAEMEDYVDDPDVMAGFYLELGPQQTEILPSVLHGSGADDAERYLELFSVGLGTALNTTDSTSSSSDYYAELANLRRHFREPADSPGMAWDRLALLQHGDFPSRWLSDVVRNNVLDHFEGDEWDQTDFRGGFTPRLGLSEDTLALAFGALGNNSAAARIALDEQSDISLEEYTNRVYGLSDSLGTGDAIVASYGQALASGSGALDDPPDKGPHASAFAFDVIQVLGQHEDTPWGMREPMGQIAATYAEELLVGSSRHDLYDRDSSMEIPEDFDMPHGLDPNFLLSPEDVYRFLHGFAHDDRYSEDFDRAVGELYETLPSQALEADLETTQNGERDPRNFEAVLQMFGTLGGLQYEAQLDVRGSEFEEDEARRQRFAQVRNFILGEAAGVGRITGAVWKASQLVAPNAVDDLLGGNPEHPRDDIEAQNLQLAVLQRYALAEIMVEAGYPTTEDAPADLFDHDTEKMLDDPEYAAEVMEDLHTWVENNSDGDADDHTFPFQDKYNSGWGMLGNGRGTEADEIASTVEW